MVLTSHDIEYGIFYPAGNVTRQFIIFFFVSSSIGVVISSAAFVILMLTAARFPEWRRIYKNQLLIQFMLARIIYIAVRYMYDIRNMYDFWNREYLLYLYKFIMSYSEMAVVCWMFVFTKHMYDSLVKVFNVEEKNIWRTAIWTWFLPSVTSVLLTMSFYIQNDKHLLYDVIFLILIKWPVLALNAVFLISILKSILNNNQCTENNFKIAIVMVLLVFMFSFQQLIVDIYKLVYVVLLDNYGSKIIVVGSIVLLYHCSFSIFFWVFGNANTRKLWFHKKHKPQIILNRNSI